MKKHIGSTIAFVIGVLSVISGLAKPGSLLITGVIIILGALSYRSAKKRKLGEVKTSWLRKSFEIAAILIALAAVLLQNNLAYLIAKDPVPNLIIPLWVIIAYSVISFKKQQQQYENKNA